MATTPSARNLARCCDAEVWPEQLPPPYEVLREKVQGCEGLVSLLTDRIVNMGVLGARAMRLLQCSAVLGLAFRRDELEVVNTPLPVRRPGA